MWGVYGGGGGRRVLLLSLLMRGVVVGRMGVVVVEGAEAEA